MWINRLYDFKMLAPATKKSISRGVQEFETISSKLRELGVTIDDDLLGIKLAAALPRENTSCRIVYTIAMQRDVISVSSVMADLDQLVTQFECDENEGSVDGSDTALPANERSWCDFCNKSVCIQLLCASRTLS